MDIKYDKILGEIREGDTGTAVIKDTHIDWGTGANQVSAVDLPVADSGEYYTGTEVETALQEIGAGTTLDSRYVNITGDTMTGALVITPTANGVSILDINQADGTAVFDVDTTNRRIIVTSGTTGQSTLEAGLIVNNASGGGAIDDFQVNSDTLTAILVDASADTMAIGVDTTINDGKNIVLNTTTGTKFGTATTQKLAFYNSTPVVQPTALTTQLTSITHTAPGTPDYALQDLVDSGVGSAWGFATQDEGNTLLSVVLNLQTRLDEVETKLQSLGLLA